jgi:hypothetical protein
MEWVLTVVILAAGPNVSEPHTQTFSAASEHACRSAAWVMTNKLNGLTGPDGVPYEFRATCTQRKEAAK